MKKLLSILAVFVLSLLTLSMVSALDTTNVDSWKTIRINGDEVLDSEVLAVEEGQTLNIRVGLVAGTAGAKDVEVEAKISGYEYSDYESLEDSTHLSDIAAGTTKYFNLEVTLPKKLDKDNYMLRLRVLDKNTVALENYLVLAVEPARHGLDIADVTFSPGNTVKAGRSLLTTVLVQNFGDRDEEDVKVTVAVPALGISASEFVDVVAIDRENGHNNVDYEDVPEMFLAIPSTAAGQYDVKVTLGYDEYESVTKTYTINVLANEAAQAQERLVLAVGPESQTVNAGAKASYAVAFTNAGTVSKAYLLEVVSGSWATPSVSTNLVVLEPGKNQVVTVDLAVAQDAPVGQQTASLLVKSASGEVLQTISLKANVVVGQEAAESTTSLRNGLEIALIVLIVVLVIIGLIIGFSRLRKDNDEEEKTYY